LEGADSIVTIEYLQRSYEQGLRAIGPAHYGPGTYAHGTDSNGGIVWASHSNCRALVNHNRQFTDEQIKELISRNAVIGVALDAWMMVPNWIRGESTPQKMDVTLEKMVDNIDHICQLAGNALHVGIGTDLDGGFGKEQCPSDLDTIADLQKIPQLLSKRGYTSEDIENIMSQNFIQFLMKNLK